MKMPYGCGWLFRFMYFGSVNVAFTVKMPVALLGGLQYGTAGPVMTWNVSPVFVSFASFKFRPALASLASIFPVHCGTEMPPPATTRDASSCAFNAGATSIRNERASEQT